MTKGLSKRRVYWEYLIAFMIIVGQHFILKYLGPRDGGSFSWPRILYPNIWLLFTVFTWYWLKPVRRFDFTYHFHPAFLKWLTVLLCASLIFQILFFQILLPTRSAVDIYKFLTLSALVPFAEELFYRGMFFHTLLRDIKRWYLAALLVSVVFAILHLSQGILAVVILFILSLALCGLAYLTRGIISCVLVHICLNALYYNKLLVSTPQRWLFSLVIILSMVLVAMRCLAGLRHETDRVTR